MCKCCYCIACKSVCVFKQKTAYEVRISDWSSDVCSSDLPGGAPSRIFIRKAMRLSLMVNVEVHSHQSPSVRTTSHLVVVLVMQTFQRDGSVDEIIRQQIGRASFRERVCQYV